MDGQFLEKKLPGSLTSWNTFVRELPSSTKFQGSTNPPIKIWKRINWGLEL